MRFESLLVFFPLIIVIIMTDAQPKQLQPFSSTVSSSPQPLPLVDPPQSLQSLLAEYVWRAHEEHSSVTLQKLELYFGTHDLLCTSKTWLERARLLDAAMITQFKLTLDPLSDAKQARTRRYPGFRIWGTGERFDPAERENTASKVCTNDNLCNLFVCLSWVSLCVCSVRCSHSSFFLRSSS